MPFTPADRAARIKAYTEGAERLRSALSQVPDEAVKWRSGPGKWSCHEIVVHCADSETNAAMRIRYLLAEKDPVIVGYDQDSWAHAFDYHAHPLGPALDTVMAVRANTAALLLRLPEDAWAREGRHTESGHYTVDDWLRVYSDHLENHAKQIERNLAAWNESRAGKP